METIKLLLANIDSVLVILSAIAGAVATICTVINQLMPEVISNKALIAIEAIMSKLSFGTKKAIVVKKK